MHPRRRSRSSFDSMPDQARVHMRERAQTIAELNANRTPAHGKPPGSRGLADPLPSHGDPPGSYGINERTAPHGRPPKAHPGSGHRPVQKPTHDPGNTAGQMNLTRALMQKSPRMLTDLSKGIKGFPSPATREGGASPEVNTGEAARKALQRIANKRVALRRASAKSALAGVPKVGRK